MADDPRGVVAAGRAAVARHDPGPTVDRLHRHEAGRARAAAAFALRVHPGAVGLLLARELTAYAEFGWRFPRDGLTESVVAEILASTASTGPSASP